MSGKQTAYMNGYDYMRIRGYAQDNLEMFLEEAKLSKQQYKTAKCQDDFVRGLEDMYHTILEERAVKEADQLDAENEKALQDIAAKDEHVDTYRINYWYADTVRTLSFNATSFNEARAMFRAIHPHSTIITVKCLLKTSYAAHKETRTPTVDFTGEPLHTLSSKELLLCDIKLIDANGTNFVLPRQYMTYQFASDYALFTAKNEHPTCTRITIHLSHRTPHDEYESTSLEEDQEEEKESMEEPSAAYLLDQHVKYMQDIIADEPHLNTYIVSYLKTRLQEKCPVNAENEEDAIATFKRMIAYDWITRIELLPKSQQDASYIPAKVILLNFAYLPIIEDALKKQTLSLGQLKRLEQEGYTFQSYHGHFTWTYEELLRLIQGEYDQFNREI